MNYALLAAAAVFLMSSSAAPEISAFEMYDELFKKYGRIHGVPWRWLKAIAWNESSIGQNWRVLAGQVSEDGKSWGLMQFTVPTARDYLGSVLSEQRVISMLNDPDVSVSLAAQYLKRLLKLFKGDRQKVVMSYNQGEGNTLRGKTYAAEYYARFQSHLAQIMERQPGSEME